jgi:hypothetical protein
MVDLPFVFPGPRRNSRPPRKPTASACGRRLTLTPSAPTLPLPRKATPVFWRTEGGGQFADWTDRVAAGALSETQAAVPASVERNIAITMWDWGDAKTYLHGNPSFGRRPAARCRPYPVRPPANSVFWNAVPLLARADEVLE